MSQRSGFRSTIRLTLRLTVVLLFLITVLLSANILRAPQKALAATCADSVHPNPPCAYIPRLDANNKPTLQCVFHIRVSSTYEEDLNTRRLVVALPNGNISGVSASDLKVLDDVFGGLSRTNYTPPNLTLVYMLGNNKANDNGCKESMFFFQSSNPNNRLYFPGYDMLAASKIPDNVGGGVAAPGGYGSVTVDAPNGVVTFNDVQYKLVVDKDSGVENNSSLGYGSNNGTGDVTPSSGGSAGLPPTTGACTLPTDAAISACNSARFLDVNHITYKNETYTLNIWAGSGDNFSDVGMSYYISSENEITHRKADMDNILANPNAGIAHLPHFQINTNPDSNGESGIDFNIDGDGSSDAQNANINDFLKTTNDVAGKQLSTDKYNALHLHYVDSDSNGNPLKPTTYTVEDADKLLIFTKYFPPATAGGAGQIGFIFTAAGSNESKLIATYTQDASDSKKFVAPQIGSSCTATNNTQGPPYFELDSDPTPATALTVISGKWFYPNSKDCNYMVPSGSIKTIVASPGETLHDYTTLAAVTDTGNNTKDDTITCETSGSTLGWILCPIINGSLGGAQSLFKHFVEPALMEAPLSTDTSTVNPVMTIWKSFRTLGNIVLIFALLFVVFGQSIGGGLVDAYTAKKTIPRILVAAILINLSIYICAVLIDVFNILGHGIVRLIIAPLKDGGQFKIQLHDSKTGYFGIIAALLALGLSAAIWKSFSRGHQSTGDPGGAFVSMLPYILLFIVIPVFLAIMSIFITLIMRKAIILSLVVVSPIALALFAVPGADKYAKKWLDAFIKTLMVYPIITGIFGISQVLAVITYNTGEKDSVTVLIATLIIAFAPLFMIPFAFKLSGGVIGGLANTVKGGRDGLKKLWGDDKHNPYSLRSTMGHAARHRVGNRMTFGAAGFNRSLLGGISRRTGRQSEYQQSRAGVDAAAAFGKEETKARGAASKTAAEARKENLGVDEKSSRAKAVEVGKMAGDAAKDHDSEATGVAAGMAGLDLLKQAEFKDANSMSSVQAGAKAAAQAHHDGITDQGQLNSIAYAEAKRHKDSGGKATPYSTEQREISNRAIIGAHQRANELGGISPEKRRAGVSAASTAAVQNMEDAAGDPTKGILAQPKLNNPIVHQTAARNAAEAIYDGRSDPKGAARKAAQTIAYTTEADPLKARIEADEAGFSVK